MVSSANVLKMTFQEALKPYEFQEWEDEAIDSHWMMSSPYPVTALMVSYLTFVTYLGPRLMADRKPFNLKYTMMVYNIAQVIYNIWFLHLYFSESKMFGYMMQEACSPSYPPRNQALRLFSFKVTWVWLMSKVADLVDTMFFVLRKKQSHISFLHLYHHTHMVVIVWLYLKYVRGEQGIMIGLVNSVVHIIMYSYYFLSALGPGVQRYLWWKRYITWLQLFQFFVLMVFFVSLLAMCSTPPLQTAYNVYAALQGVIFTVLFLNFYFKSYNKTSRKSSKVTKSVENSSKHVKLGK